LNDKNHEERDKKTKKYEEMEDPWKWITQNGTMKFLSDIPFCLIDFLALPCATAGNACLFPRKTRQGLREQKKYRSFLSL
jgi:hypothetical protein